MEVFYMKLFWPRVVTIKKTDNIRCWWGHSAVLRTGAHYMLVFTFWRQLDFLLFSFWDRVLLCCLGWSWTCYVAQAGLLICGPPISAFRDGITSVYCHTKQYRRVF
jgi:hypothetical protein